MVTINAGVQVGIQKVNITISDVEAELELIIRLGNCKSPSLIRSAVRKIGSFSDFLPGSGGHCESHHLKSKP